MVEYVESHGLPAEAAANGAGVTRDQTNLCTWRKIEQISFPIYFKIRKPIFLGPGKHEETTTFRWSFGKTDTRFSILICALSKMGASDLCEQLFYLS